MQIAVISKLSRLLNKKPRNSERRRRTLPVSIRGVPAAATTRDLSFSGVYFEARARYEVGSAINMTINLGIAPPLRATQLECEAIVVRVEKKGSKAGVAARINTKTTALTTQ
jgi:hypothetical protein